MAGYHAIGSGITDIFYELQQDAEAQRLVGVFDEQTFEDAVNRLTALLIHYVDVDPTRVVLFERERELMVPLRSRTGRQRSTRYRLHCLLDGVHIDDQLRPWIVEFKLRGRLQTLEQILLNRQIRWYAWAWREITGREPAGVIVDERLNELPGSVRRNQNGSISKVQSCTLGAYQAACLEVGQEPDEEVERRLREKVYQQRHHILLRPEELDEAGWQLTSSAELTHLMDTGALYPVRNPSPARCPGCPFRAICPDPSNTDLIDALYERTEPKRLRATA